ncbi:MAG: hypothetical protein ACKVOM_05695 [Ferruginibacter sp.]
MNRKIYQSKSKTIISIALTVVIILGLTVYMVGYNDDPVTDLISLIIIGFLIYLIYSCIGLFIKVFKKIPVLIFSDFAIEVSRNFKNESFSCGEISDWQILHHADSTEIALTIGGGQKFIEISDLMTTTSEIRNILETVLPDKEFMEK